MNVKENPMKSHLEEKRGELISRREELIAGFAETARLADDTQLGPIFKDIRLTNEFIGSLERIALETGPEEVDLVPRFAVSSLFLHESFKKLTADQDEQFFFITGSEVEGVFVLDQMAEFEQDKRSWGGVTANTRSTHRLLIKLEQFGHRLLAHFHSHPTGGIGSTQPSGTDRDFQRRLEDAGHKAVMAIFSRDGFVRFQRLDQNFRIEIFGEGVEKHAENIFRLTNLDPA
jgi:hypothetical protein